MGREIRRVPRGWEHPKDERGRYKPLFDEDYETAASEWARNFMAWENGEREQHGDAPRYFWDWEGNPPDEEYYRPAWGDDEATHYQVYENVTEGTPVSPVFATLDELRAWLLEQGHSEHAASKFIEAGYAFSMVMTPRGVSGLGIDSWDALQD